MPILLPKRIGAEHALKRATLYFLAGPVRGGGDWQAKMAEIILAAEPDAQIAIPCRWDATHKMMPRCLTPFDREAPNRQLVWERHYLSEAGLNFDRSGCIIFWLGLQSTESPHPGPEPYAMDTRRELGSWKVYRALKNARVVIGGHIGFHGLDVILNEFAETAGGKGFPFYTEMTDLAEAARREAMR